MRGLQGKAAIVTGGGSGIGRAICQRMGEEGCKVGVFDINKAGAEETAGLITAAGGTAEAFEADISDLGAVQSAVASFESALGPTGRSTCTLPCCRAWSSARRVAW